MKTEKSVEEKVVEASEKADDHLITLSTGVVLRAKTAAPMGLIRIMAAFPRPKVPEYMNTRIGRIMENPDDPDYRERVTAHKAEQGAAMLNALILLGTEVESVPKKFPKHTDDSWIDELTEIGVQVNPDKDSSRYLNWIMFKAAPKTEDVQAIQEKVGSLSGVPEGAVQTAEDFSRRQ